MLEQKRNFIIFFNKQSLNLHYHVILFIKNYNTSDCVPLKSSVPFRRINIIQVTTTAITHRKKYFNTKSFMKTYVFYKYSFNRVYTTTYGAKIC